VDILPLTVGDQQVIEGYGKTGFRVSGREWQGGIVVFPGHTLAWPIGSLAELSISAFDAVRDENPAIEILLIGTGQRMALLPTSLRAALRALGFGIEAMDTGAACRTYNVLIGEHRRVAAALLPAG
jgi:uncharacterized protein